MKTSTLEQLKDPATVVLAAGHGAGDPGAVFGTFKERDEAIIIVDLMAADLRARGVNVVIAPHKDDLSESIAFVNQNFGSGDAWVLEIHRDSADHLSAEDASLRCGVYYGPSEGGKKTGEFIRASFLRQGAHANSWARPDTESRFGSLGWIRQTRPAAHLLELAFMEGRNDDAHLQHLAQMAATAVFEAFTGSASGAVPSPGTAALTQPAITPAALFAPTTNHLHSRSFSGNASLEAVADGHRVLRSGSQKVDGTAQVQAALNLLASLGGNYSVDLGANDRFAGFFGPKTERAVLAFEADFNLTTNGIVDVETILALDEAVGKAEQGKNPLPVVPFTAPGSVYVPPAGSRTLLSGVDFSKGKPDAGKKYRDVFAAADVKASLAAGDPSNCQALLQFPKAVFFDAKMAICADGSPRSDGNDPGSIDRPHGQLQTAKKNPVNGKDFNAETVPYVVLPGAASHGSFVKDFGIKDLDLAVIICDGRVSPAFYGEVGPSFRLGEASIQVHENLVPAVPFPWTTPAKVRIRNSSVEGKILYFIFPGTAIAKTAGMSADEWLAKTLQAATDRFAAFVSSGGVA